MTKQIPMLSLSVGLAFMSMACVGNSEADRKTTQERLKEYVLAAAPKEAHPLKHEFDGKVALVGYKLSRSGSLKPGQKVKLTLYWKLLSDLDPEWNLFTHVLDGSGERLLNIDNVGPLREWKGSRQVFGPGDWEVGKYYADEQTFTVPKDVKTK